MTQKQLTKLLNSQIDPAYRSLHAELARLRQFGVIRPQGKGYNIAGPFSAGRKRSRCKAELLSPPAT